jgi:LysM repeat protein
MDGRRGSPARLLAPIALVAFVFALVVVVGSSDTPDDSNDDRGRASQRQDGQIDNAGQATTATPETPVAAEFYTVKTGDTLAAIAETVGVPVERLQELNPDLDPQALVSGQKIRLRE